MRKTALVLAFIMFCLVNLSSAQDIFNPADLINDYPVMGNPALPDTNQVGKWYRTPRVDWNTSEFKSYIYNGMAFRLRFPNNYNKADVSTKYPLILFFHGGGEIGPITDNEHQLLHGAKVFQDSMNAGKFNAFMLFPQLSSSSGWDYSYFEKINKVLDILKQYNNLDEDRVISMGLSHGGFGSIYYSLSFPGKAASVIASSPAMVHVFSEASKRDLIHIPLYFANGGRDNNPEPFIVKNFVDSFASKGGDVRHLYLPAQDHGTWLDHWYAGDLVNYWKNAHKANPLIFFQKNVFCPDSVISAKVGITPGFAQYQWQKNLVTIPGATSNEYTVTSFGSYRVRFRRLAFGPWSEWSPNPAVISARPTIVPPDIMITGLKSKVLPAADGSTTVPLELPAGYDGYEWRRVSDNALVSTQRTFTAVPGVYKAMVVACRSTFSKNFTVVNAAANPKPDAAINLTAIRATATQINLSWGVARVTLATPTAYEIYRSTTSGGSLSLIAVVPATPRTYIDRSDVTASSKFFYKVRAVNENSGASLSNEATPVESVAPTVPQDLIVVNTGKTFVTLDWTNSTDNVGVTGYDVFVDGVKKYSCAESAITADLLKPGTSYSFTVKAHDDFGNLSAASAAVSSTTPMLAIGLQYRFYQGSWDSLPNFNALTHLANGSVPNLDISLRTAGINDYFGFVWEGYITIPTSGTYSFELGSDDGSKFYWNTLYSPSATALINNDFAHGNEPTVSRSITVAAGTYPIAITYYDAWGAENMKLFWTGPGIARKQVPDAAFIETVPIFDDIAPSVPANMRVTYTGKNAVNLAWDNSTDNVGVTGYDVYLNDVLKTISLSNSISIDSLTASTLYRFKVRARDAAANISGFSSEASATTTLGSSGLNYKYYEGNWNALPDFNLLTPVQTGMSANVDINVRPAGREDYFAFLWEGKITIPVAGTYVFELASDDGSKLYFGTPYSAGATALVDNDSAHGYLPSKFGTITLASGTYPIAISYLEIWGGESMNVYWTKPNGVREQIPNSAFIEPSPDVISPTMPANFKTFYTGRTFIDLTWDSSLDDLGVAGYDVYVNGSTTPVSTATNALTISNLTPNTVYDFRVQARDAAGNLSPFATISANSTASGLRYKYYEGEFELLPNFNTLPVLKKGTTANIDVAPRKQDDFYAFVWEGYITIPNTGNYTFELSSDDGSKFYFNTLYDPTATALVDADGAHGYLPFVTGTKMIAAGIYPVTITYFEKWGGERMELYWSGPGITKQLVPDAAFTENFKVVPTSIGRVNEMSSVELGTELVSAPTALKVKLFPNPFVSDIKMQINNPASGNHVTAVVTDLNGRIVSRKDFGGLSAGINLLSLPTGTGLKPGVYLIRINVNGLPAGVWKVVKENN